MKMLFPLILALIGTGAGVGAGIMLRPAPTEEHAANETHCLPGETHVSAEAPEVTSEVPAEEVAYAQLEDQFVIPVIADDKIAAMVVLSIGIAVPPGGEEAVLAVEPRLRDGLLQVMFNHANIGGFSGNFTSTSNMRILREDLLASAQAVLGKTALDVLVLDIVRQDV
ncbi:flagellar basal body-associated FliL family protein [Yoonia sp. R2331]|uniref:flagellar basal body-associated FliL family protein n=1 Tax=Yoonia sp. R2331 TaxID=3237238 RepID=UPI0034E5202A